jgi:hypothetical protein
MLTVRNDYIPAMSNNPSTVLQFAIDRSEAHNPWTVPLRMGREPCIGAVRRERQNHACSLRFGGNSKPVQVIDPGRGDQWV